MPESDPKPQDIISRLDTEATDATDGLTDWYPLLQKRSEKNISMEDRENRGIIDMRNRWSNAILFLIVLIVCFDIVLVSLVGSGIWSFTNTSIVIAVITDNFLKIVGLGYLITTKLFEKIFPHK